MHFYEYKIREKKYFHAFISSFRFAFYFKRADRKTKPTVHVFFLSFFLSFFVDEIVKLEIVLSDVVKQFILQKLKAEQTSSLNYFCDTLSIKIVLNNKLF